MKTRDDADFRLLSLANEKGKFALSLSNTGIPDVELQAAFERGIDGEWFTLVDVSIIAATERPVLMRVFKLTQYGSAYRATLAAERRTLPKAGRQ